MAAKKAPATAKDGELFTGTNAPTKERPQPAAHVKPEPKIIQRSSYDTFEEVKPTAKARELATVKPHASPANMLEIIASAAANPAVDVTKMQALLAMQKEIMSEEARMAFTSDFIAMQAELPIINAKGRIEIEAKKPGGKKQSTPYATFNEIAKVTKPILQRHGFALWSAPDVGPESRIIMRVYLDHVRGHSKTCAIPLPLETSGSKNNVQGVGSSISYGKRYGAIALLNLTSEAKEDADLDGTDPEKVEAQEKAADAAHKPISAKQAAEVNAAILDCGIDMTRFLDKYGIQAPAELTIAEFDNAIASCRNYKEQRAK